MANAAAIEVRIYPSTTLIAAWERRNHPAVIAEILQQIKGAYPAPEDKDKLHTLLVRIGIAIGTCESEAIPLVDGNLNLLDGLNMLLRGITK